MRLDNNDSKIYPFAPIELGSLEAEQDSGAITLFNMPVSSTPSAGDEMSASLMIDSEVILKVYAEADGTGGIQNKGLVITQGSASVPGIAFDSDLDTGIYGGSAQLNFSIAGSAKYLMTNTYIGSGSSTGALLRQTSTSTTLPGCIPYGTDTDSGLGWHSADNPCIVSGGAESARFEDPADLAAGETSLWLYDDDNGTMEQVTVGAADSGGAGYKVLRIPN